MSEERPWKRIRERLELSLPVRVHCRETLDLSWMEVTRLNDVTPFGAGFTLKHPTEPGRLLQMTIPMPRQLRVFDHVEDQYRVWAVVRHVKALSSETGTAFHVGVAFIGKRPPASYEEKPWERYEISTSALDALSPIEEVVKQVVTSDQRAQTRHNISVDMLLEILDEKGGVAASEFSVTENISRRGATLFTTIEVEVGRFTRLTSSQYNLTVHAPVRAVSIGADGIRRIHVEFIDKDWPL
ncbi:MAG: hypothetical protein ABR555_00885 [Pyrinomonadaceae bacterium]